MDDEGDGSLKCCGVYPSAFPYCPDSVSPCKGGLSATRSSQPGLAVGTSGSLAEYWLGAGGSAARFPYWEDRSANLSSCTGGRLATRSSHPGLAIALPGSSCVGRSLLRLELHLEPAPPEPYPLVLWLALTADSVAYEGVGTEVLCSCWKLLEVEYESPGPVAAAAFDEICPRW